MIIRLAEDETDTGTTTEANEPFEVDDDVLHEASENKEQGKFLSSWSSLYTWLTYDKDKNKMYCGKLLKIDARVQFYTPRASDYCLNSKIVMCGSFAILMCKY
jgi:hypothetical protein